MVKNEITSLRTAWHLAVAAGLLPAEYPNKRLVHLERDEPRPHQTRDEIEGHVAAAKLTGVQVDELWGSLYIRPHEITELLEHGRVQARRRWIYPLACLAGHTDARRSELRRTRIAEVDFEGSGITIQEPGVRDEGGAWAVELVNDVDAPALKRPNDGLDTGLLFLFFLHTSPCPRRGHHAHRNRNCSRTL